LNISYGLSRRRFVLDDRWPSTLKETYIAYGVLPSKSARFRAVCHHEGLPPAPHIKRDQTPTGMGGTRFNKMETMPG